MALRSTTAAIDPDKGGEPSWAANRSAWASENPARMPAAIDETASVNCSSSNARSRVGSSRGDEGVSNGEIKNHASFIWSVADLLRGTYKQSEYAKVVLPLVVIRRLDCVLEPTKDAVLTRAKSLKGKVENVEPVLRSVAGQQFYNTSPLDLRRLLDDPNNIAPNLRAYIGGFSDAARDIIDRFDFNTQISRLDKANLLYKVVSRFADIDLHPEAVSNIEMGYLYEELIRRFSELSNETAGEHFTPREVIRLMVNLDEVVVPGAVLPRVPPFAALTILLVAARYSLVEMPLAVMAGRPWRRGSAPRKRYQRISHPAGGRTA